MLPSINTYASVKGLLGLKDNRGKGSPIVYFNILSKFTLFENFYKGIFVLQMPSVTSRAKGLYPWTKVTERELMT